MSYYFRRGNEFHVADKDSIDMHTALPVGNYSVEFHPMTGFYLTKVDRFTLPPKLYGSVNAQTDRVLNTYGLRAGNTGVLLAGEKGSGKTLFAKVLAEKFATAHKAPTLIVTRPYNGSAFNKFLQTIDQPCVVLFDEFEKVYTNHYSYSEEGEDKDDDKGENRSQTAILTLLDGVYPSRKLFVLTCNDKYRIDKHMLNRPGRLFYMLDFSGLDEPFIRDFCGEALKPSLRHNIDAVVRVASLFDAMNFDMLHSLVEEMNRYDEAPAEALQMLNIKPDTYAAPTFDLEVRVGGKLQDPTHTTTSYQGHPLAEKAFNVVVYDEKRGQHKRVTFKHSDLKKVDHSTGTMLFVSGRVSVVFKKRVETYGYSRLYEHMLD